MLDPENPETLAATDLAAAKAAWAEWEAASAATEAAHKACDPRAFNQRTYYSARTRALREPWEATLPRLAAARKAIAGLPSLGEIAAYELHVEAMRLEDEKQGSLL